MPAQVVDAFLGFVNEHLLATARLTTLVKMHEDPTLADLQALQESATYLAGVGQILIEYRHSQLKRAETLEP